MLCNECLKKIKKDEEVQIKGLNFCKECFESDEEIKKDIIAKCHYCSRKIFSGDIFHETSMNSGSKLSEKLIFCQDCHREVWMNSALSKKIKTLEKKMSNSTIFFIKKYWKVSQFETNKKLRKNLLMSF